MGELSFADLIRFHTRRIKSIVILREMIGWDVPLWSEHNMGHYTRCNKMFYGVFCQWSNDLIMFAKQCVIFIIVVIYILSTMIENFYLRGNA